MLGKDWTNNQGLFRVVRNIPEFHILSAAYQAVFLQEKAVFIHQVISVSEKYIYFTSQRMQSMTPSVFFHFNSSVQGICQASESRSITL